MVIKKEDVITQIDEALSQFDSYKKNYVDPWAERGPYTTIDQSLHVLTTLLTTIQRYSPKTSSFFVNSQKISDKLPDPDIRNLCTYIEGLAGILLSLRDAYQKDFLKTFEEQVHGEIFNDFLEMAEYLLQNKFKDAAAVMIGCVLEEHIRKLCSNSGVELLTDKASLKKTDFLNAELTKQEIYNTLQQKQITAWLGIRNSAAHGKVEEYSQNQVEMMLNGVRDFMIRYPA